MKLTVKAARTNAGISQQAAAKALGISAGGYASKEQGKSRFYFEEIAILSRLFKVDIGVFL